MSKINNNVKSSFSYELILGCPLSGRSGREYKIMDNYYCDGKGHPGYSSKSNIRYIVIRTPIIQGIIEYVTEYRSRVWDIPTLVPDTNLKPGKRRKTSRIWDSIVCPYCKKNITLIVYEGVFTEYVDIEKVKIHRNSFPHHFFMEEKKIGEEAYYNTAIILVIKMNHGEMNSSFSFHTSEWEKAQKIQKPVYTKKAVLGEQKFPIKEFFYIKRKASALLKWLE